MEKIEHISCDFFFVEGEKKRAKNTPYRLTKNKHGKKLNTSPVIFFFVEGEKKRAKKKTPKKIQQNDDKNI